MQNIQLLRTYCVTGSLPVIVRCSLVGENGGMSGVDMFRQILKKYYLPDAEYQILRVTGSIPVCPVAGQ